MISDAGTVAGQINCPVHARDVWQHGEPPLHVRLRTRSWHPAAAHAHSLARDGCRCWRGGHGHAGDRGAQRHDDGAAHRPRHLESRHPRRWLDPLRRAVRGACVMAAPACATPAGVVVVVTVPHARLRAPLPHASAPPTPREHTHTPAKPDTHSSFCRSIQPGVCRHALPRSQVSLVFSASYIKHFQHKTERECGTPSCVCRG